MKRLIVPLALVSGFLLTASVDAQTTRTTTTTTTRYQSCKKIHSIKIRTSDGVEVPVDDVLIDPSSGRIVTVVTSYENRYYPIPWNVVHVNEDASVATLDITRERLVS